MKIPFKPPISFAKIKLILFVVGLIGAFGAGWMANGWRLNLKASNLAARGAVEARNAIEGARQREASANALAGRVAAQVLAAVEGVTVRSVDRERIITNEIREVSRYSECTITPSVLSALNNAIRDANTATGGVSTEAAPDSAD